MLRSRHVTLLTADIQKQEGNSDCGLFAGDVKKFLEWLGKTLFFYAKTVQVNKINNPKCVKYNVYKILIALDETW